MADKKIRKTFMTFENFISCKMISQITTLWKNLKIGQTVHGLISSLMYMYTVTLKCNRSITLPFRNTELDIRHFVKNVLIEEMSSHDLRQKKKCSKKKLYLSPVGKHIENSSEESQSRN